MAKVYLIGADRVKLSEHVLNFIEDRKKLGQEVILVNTINDVPEEVKQNYLESVFEDMSSMMKGIELTLHIRPEPKFENPVYFSDAHQRKLNRKKKWENPNKFHR